MNINLDNAQANMDALLAEERAKPKRARIPIAKVVKDPVLQVREGLKMDRVSEYKLIVAEDPEKLPPIRAYQDGENYYVPDGWHRLAAHEAAGLSFIWALVSQGTRQDAVLEAVSANASHGEPRTNADKRRAIKTLLVELPEWRAKSDRQIAKACALTHHELVGVVRRELEEAGLIPSQGRREGADGRQFEAAKAKPSGGFRQSKELLCQWADSPCEEQRTPPARYCEAHIDQARRELAEWTAPKASPSPVIEEGVEEEVTPKTSVDSYFARQGKLHPRTLLPSEASSTRPSGERPSDARGAEERAAYREQVETNRSERHERIASQAKSEQAPGKLGPFSVLYVDPPWQYHAKVSEDRAIEQHYPTLSLADLCALPVSSICAKDAVLYLWVTAPLAEEACALIKAWGFTYKSQAVWVKQGGSPGLGHWWRVDHELLYVATRGSFPTPPLAARISSVIERPKGKHSEKPSSIRDMIDSLCPGHPKVEIFARQTAEGWTSIGNEIDGRDIRDVLREVARDERQGELPVLAAPPEKSAPGEASGEVYLCLYCGETRLTPEAYQLHKHPEADDRQHEDPEITSYEVKYPDGRKQSFRSWNYDYTREEYFHALGLIAGARLWFMDFDRGDVVVFESSRPDFSAVPRDMIISAETPDINGRCLECSVEEPLRSMTTDEYYPGYHLCASCANPQPKPKKKASKKKSTQPDPIPPTTEEIEAFKEALKAFEKVTSAEEANEVWEQCETLLEGCDIQDPRRSLRGEAWCRYGAPLAEEANKKESRERRKAEKKASKKKDAKPEPAPEQKEPEKEAKAPRAGSIELFKCEGCGAKCGGVRPLRSRLCEDCEPQEEPAPFDLDEAIAAIEATTTEDECSQAWGVAEDGASTPKQERARYLAEAEARLLPGEKIDFGKKAPRKARAK
jgi:N6-adenosine-specific RNA methylase IME4